MEQEEQHAQRHRAVDQRSTPGPCKSCGVTGAEAACKGKGVESSEIGRGHITPAQGPTEDFKQRISSLTGLETTPVARRMSSGNFWGQSENHSKSQKD